MTYVPGFTHDIFVSYPMEAEAWTHQLVEELKQAPGLAALKDLKFYFAKSDWRLGQASDEMLAAARSGALLMAVVTKDALSEEQTRFLAQEVRAFRESGSLNGRFCPIPLHPLNSHELSRLAPSENPQGFWNTNLEFFFKEDGVAMWLEPSVEPRQGEYRKRVTKLSWHLRDRLDELKSRQSVPESADKKGPFAGKVVLLARKEADIEREWNEVRTLLRNDGVTLLSSDVFLSAPGAGNDVPKVPDLFVQLLSPLDPTDDAKAQLAAVEALGPVPVVQWRKQTNPKLLALMDEDDRRLFDGPHVLAVGLEEFKRDIREKLKELARPRAAGASYDKPYLYITADTVDLRYAREVQAVARKRTVADVMLEDESGRRDDFEEGLKRAAGIIFLYGDAERRFIDRWLKEYVRKTSLLQVHPRLVALYQAPPRKTIDEEPLVPFDDLRTVGSQEKFSLEPIEEICAELDRDRA